MPIPFILLGGSILAGAVGAGKGVSAHAKNKDAKQIMAEAQNAYEETREAVDAERKHLKGCLDRLGALRIDIGAKEMKDFVSAFGAFENIRNDGGIALDDLTKLKRQGWQSLKEMETASMKAAEIAQAGAASLGSGALAGIAAYGGAMMFASASTGTAIASLSGAAATNATLAWFGGGSLAAGGLGMAGGAAVLGGIVVGPVLAVSGFVQDAKAKENLAYARAKAAEADEAVEKMAVMIDFMKRTADIAEDYSRFLVRFRSPFGQIVNELQLIRYRAEQRQRRMGVSLRGGKVDFDSLTEAEQKKLQQSWLMAQVMQSVLSVSLLTKEGELAPEAQKTLKAANTSCPAASQGTLGIW